MTRFRRLPLAGAALLLVGQADVRPSAAAATEPVRVRASAAFAACLAPALDSAARAAGVPVVLVTADPDPPQDADLVVGDDLEMTRLLESGTAEVASAVDLGQVPWVMVVPEGAPGGSLSAFAMEPVAVLGGRAGREARASLGALAAGRLAVTSDAGELRRARYALVPRSLAGPGERRASAVRPLVATAALIANSPRRASAARLLARLAGTEGRRALGPCFDPMPQASAQAAPARAAAVYAQSVVDWWMPACSLASNRYVDPNEVLGPPDAVNLGGQDNYLGFISLGQGGYVTVDMGVTFTDADGPDVRVYQTTTGEPVTVYASAAPQGPFTLIGLRVPCGVRTGGGVFSNHCDFDLHDGGLASARYLKIEDGEIYPCLARGTVTEGADIDAVEILGGRN
ncbi:MAG TPA: hypothetical protein VEQ84_05205 [Vicinamibacteria bacterium]|nr:hypothetical protein [Vicinamibacteria bacterium]